MSISSSVVLTVLFAAAAAVGQVSVSDVQAWETGQWWDVELPAKSFRVDGGLHMVPVGVLRAHFTVLDAEKTLRDDVCYEIEVTYGPGSGGVPPGLAEVFSKRRDRLYYRRSDLRLVQTTRFRTQDDGTTSEYEDPDTGTPTPPVFGLHRWLPLIITQFEAAVDGYQAVDILMPMDKDVTWQRSTRDEEGMTLLVGTWSYGRERTVELRWIRGQPWPSLITGEDIGEQRLVAFGGP